MSEWVVVHRPKSPWEGHADPYTREEFGSHNAALERGRMLARGKIHVYVVSKSDLGRLLRELGERPR